MVDNSYLVGTKICLAMSVHHTAAILLRVQTPVQSRRSGAAPRRAAPRNSAEQLRSKGPRWLAGAHAFAKRGATDGGVGGEGG